MIISICVKRYYNYDAYNKSHVREVYRTNKVTVNVKIEKVIYLIKISDVKLPNLSNDYSNTITRLVT